MDMLVRLKSVDIVGRILDAVAGSVCWRTLLLGQTLREALDEGEFMFDVSSLRLGGVFGSGKAGLA